MWRTFSSLIVHSISLTVQSASLIVYLSPCSPSPKLNPYFVIYICYLHIRQENGRAQLVGEKTFGKGVIQNLQPLRQGGVAVTIAKYETPLHNNINKIGIVSFLVSLVVL